MLGEPSGGRGGTVVKSNYTNGYSGLGWDGARLAQQSLMKNGLFHLSSPQLTWWPTTVFYCGVGVPHCHSTKDAYDQCERDLYF